MPNSNNSPESRGGWELPPVTPLDESAWQRWQEKGRAGDARSKVAFLKAVKYASIAGLLVIAGLWSTLLPYDVLLRFVVTGGAIILSVQSLKARQYGFAAAFGALALVYNPVAPAFLFSGDWQRALVVASALPFIASLAWPKARPVHNA